MTGYLQDYHAKVEPRSISVIMAALNEGELVDATLRSARETAAWPNKHSFIVVDQGGNLIKEPCTLLKEEPCGVDTARLKGLGSTSTDIVVLCDAHMRFAPHWDKLVVLALEQHNALFCSATALYDLPSPYPSYGAELKEHPDGYVEVRYSQKYIGLQERYPLVEAPIGAFYFCDRTVVPIDQFWPRNLSRWGSSEEYCSLACKAIGIDIRVARFLEIGHFFRPKHPYVVSWDSIWHNRHVVTKTFFSDYLEKKEKFLQKYSTSTLLDMLEKSHEKVLAQKDQLIFLKNH